jgi:hypothetical protein
MPQPPPINPDANDIADRAKYGYAAGAQLLATMQYRLAELAGTGRLDPEESKSLQRQLVSIWEALYSGTVCAVRDWDTDDCTWDEADNTYSDGREVMIQVTIEPREASRGNWEHNRFTVGDGAVNEHPLGTICYLSPINPEDVRVVRDPLQSSLPTDFGALQRRLLQAAIDAGDDEAEPHEGDGDDEIL